MRPSLFSRARAAAPALVLALVLLTPAAAHAYVLTSADDADSNDFIVLYSLGYYLSLFPGQDIAVFKDANFRQMSPGEPVWVVAHGDIGKIGGKTSSALLTLFTAEGLPKTTPSVYLFGCRAGTKGRFGEALTMQLGTSMQADWEGIKAVGPIGCSITEARLGRWSSERVVPEGNRLEVARIQQTLKEHYHPQEAVNAWIEAYQRDHGGQDPSLKDRAEMAYHARAVVDFFQELIARCQGLIEQPDEGFCIAPGGPC